MAPHTIKISYDGRVLTCAPDKLTGVRKGDKVEWVTNGTDIKDWLVIFGAGAPVKPVMTHKGQHPPNDKIKIVDYGHRRRKDPKNPDAEDKRPVKYCVVATVANELKWLDPEIIVDPDPDV